jgi:hypothetical protein
VQGLPTNGCPPKKWLPFKKHEIVAELEQSLNTLGRRFESRRAHFFTEFPKGDSFFKEIFINLMESIFSWKISNVL